MDSIKDLINKISDFRCEVDNKEIVFPGILQEENGNIVLNAKLPREQYLKIAKNAEFPVSGNIFDKKITLMRCHIKSASSSTEHDCMYIFAIPSEIIVGGYFYREPMVKRITVFYSDLNYMFSGRSRFEFNAVFQKENPNVPNHTFPEPIIAKDEHGEIMLYQTFENQCSVNSCIHSIISVTQYSFTTPLLLMTAVKKASAARILFSFFGNRYISYGEITFEATDDENNYSLWLNYKEDVPPVNEPFLITASEFETSFQSIWVKWLELYESANPIPTLFYEIICNRSTRVNGFLNLSQAIEVYSNAFRNEQAKEIAREDPKNSKHDVKLMHRYQDILSEYTGALDLPKSNIAEYAQGFSNMRNYYTHYNTEKYIEPTYEELFSAIHILRFVLLAIVYTSVGIPRDFILKCKKRVVFSRLDNDAQTILKYSKKMKDSIKEKHGDKDSLTDTVVLKCKSVSH